MEVLQVKGVRILDEQFYGLLRALCGLRRRGNCFVACAQNLEVCNRLIRFLGLQHPAGSRIAGGTDYTCAVKANGELVCFGWNDFGQCDIPPDLGQVVAVAAGSQHTCAVKADGKLVCFGRNDNGQCDVPPDLGPVGAVAAGSTHTWAVKANGELVFFGFNVFVRCYVPPDLGPVAVAAVGSHTCAVKADGDLVCFGWNIFGQCDVPPDLGPAVAVAAGSYHTCAVKANGELVCFGDNDYGQCNVPPELGPVVTVAAGHRHTCAVKADGELVCFGDNDYGQCNVPPELGPVAVAAGSHHSWALKANGHVPPDLGLTEPVVQPVHHSGPATVIPEHEAAEIVAEQEASFIEHNLDSAGWYDHQASLQVHHARHRVVVLHFSRSPPELKESLEGSEELMAVRKELEQAGGSWTLHSGTKVLLRPGVYKQLLRHLSRNPHVKLQSCHVLVSEDLEEAVMAQVHKLRSRLQVRLRHSETLSFSAASTSSEMLDGEASEWDTEDVEIVVNRTFIELRPCINEFPDAITQTTSQMRPGPGYGNITNPRMAAPGAEFFED